MLSTGIFLSSKMLTSLCFNDQIWQTDWFFMIIHNNFGWPKRGIVPYNTQILDIPNLRVIFNCREAWPRPRPREYRPRDRGFSPSMEPTAKRMRHEYFGGGDSYYNHYNPYHAAAHRYAGFHLLFFLVNLLF